MLNSVRKLLQSGRWESILLLAVLSLYASCTPTPIQSSAKPGGVSDGNSSSGGSSYPNPTYPLTGTFLQEGAVRTKTSFTLPVDFADSFMLRGDELSTYLRKIPNTTKFCLAGKFTYISGQDRFLVLAAKPQLFTDLVKKTTEYFLKVEPANQEANQNDCLVYNLTNSLFQGASAPTMSFSLSQLCSNCSNAVTSSGLRLFFINGEEVPGITTSTLLMTLSGSTGTSTGNSCSSSSACVARGFNCCLQGQCVNDGTEKPGASSLPGYDVAKEDVRINPLRYVLYPQYYFVCDSTTGTSGGSGGGGETTDPDYDAQLDLLESQYLSECVNKTDGEFSYCTLKYTNADELIPATFPLASESIGDINFSTVNTALGSGNRGNNIARIRYAGQVIYDQLKGIPLTGGTFGTANDNLTTAQTVTVNMALPTSAPDRNLYITYKTDGTCQKIGSSLAKCTKTYIQSASDTSQTTYHDSSKTFKLPTYADLSPTSNVIVKIGGVTVAEDASTWQKLQSPNRIVFASSYPLFQNQSVEITYYVTSSTSVTALTELRSAAQAEINTRCAGSSPTGNWNLKPRLENGSLVEYVCDPPQVNTEAPANQTVLVSGKTVPHRYFDQNGVNYGDNYSTAPDQELNPFAYTNGNVTSPNNVTSYVGFNEIYGSFTKNSSSSARPAKEARVKKDQTYDILVTSGSFSTCATCGNDYYSALQKLFPQNFSGQGGGYSPFNYETRRENATSIYRADDLLYGRACFLPVTMIPWTHVLGADAKTQRRARLSAQHFLFANGYQRDWYGFDYGSLIGSFDGVTWFSIGNQRRIKATSNKLFLAVNAYFGDLTQDNTFSVNITETTAATSVSLPVHDSESDGAECQRAHFCSTDNDCIRSLGYDYSCQNVSGFATNWPVFDPNGAETVGTNSKSLASILGGTNSQNRRCVYRGRGAPCEPDLNSLSGSFNGSSLIGAAACSANNYCQTLSGTNSNRFNDRIARFATSPTNQSPVSDLVGLGARVIGRPFDFYGTKTAPTLAASALAGNNVDAVCIPGRNLASASTTYDLNRLAPGTRTDSSDRIIGAGVTGSGSQSPNYYNACTATDAAGVMIQHYPLGITDTVLGQMTISQNLSTNLLNLTPLTALNIFSTTNGSQTTATGYQRNACLRAPGASCFSDLDCGPSEFAATRAQTANLSTVLNPAEEKFWEEALVCGNPDFKNVAAGVLNPSFDVKKNLCCRENGNILTTFTQMTGDTNSPLWCNTTTKVPLVAGVNQPISTKRRYSRVHTAFDKMTCDPAQVTSSRPFALSLDAANTTERLQQILYQYKTLDTVNSRTCCTSHWVRSFASENGGGHAFARTKMQTVDKTMFKHVSWAPNNTTLPGIDDEPFGCDPNNFTNSSCEVKSLTTAEQTKYLTWAGTLELIGIPQVAVMSNDDVFKLVDDAQLNIAGAREPLNNSIQDVNVVGEDFNDGAKKYYSAASYTKFDMTTLKKVFSENEFNCCIPTGQQVPDTTTAGQCCTGFVASSGTRRCCLPDFTDVTVYLNRYVSSEGRGLAESAYDPKTGYIKDPNQVLSLVTSKNLCCSGRAMVGVAVSQLSIPLKGDQFPLPATFTSTTRRLNYREDDVDNNVETGSVGSFFDAGIRWNNHVYCVPTSMGN